VEQCRIVLRCQHPCQTVAREALNRASTKCLSFEGVEAEMPRYYLHLRSDDSFVWDEEGGDLPDPDHARSR
jgi:hypothetical protein